MRCWFRRRAAQRALNDAHRRAIDRALDFALPESRRQQRILREVKAGLVSATPELVADMQAGNREADRLIAAYRRIERRLSRNELLGLWIDSTRNVEGER